MTDVLLPDILLTDAAQLRGPRAGGFVRGRAVVSNGRIAGLDAPKGGAAHILLPPLTEAHCHLDKCHTIARLGAVGGDLPDAIARQFEDKAHWTTDDLRRRTARGLTEARAAGCGRVRTHVDWGEAATPPLAWSVLGDLAPDDTLQRAALTGVMQWTDPDFADAVARQLAADRGVLGAFVYDQPGLEQGLAALFEAAQHHALPLDFHVDEGLGSMNGLEAIADAALACGYDGPILCGHAVSLMDRDAVALARIIDKLLSARIAICALPTTNLYLQGRLDGTPDRRGITRLRELHAAGVPIVIGSDNVGDAFCPTGAHDPMAALNLAVYTAHLDPPLDRWLPSVTTDAARAIGATPDHIDTTAIAQLNAYATDTLSDVVAGRARPIPAAKVLQ